MQEGDRQKNKEPEKHRKKWFWNKDDVASVDLKHSRRGSWMNFSERTEWISAKIWVWFFSFFLSIFSLKILVIEGSGSIFNISLLEERESSNSSCLTETQNLESVFCPKKLLSFVREQFNNSCHEGIAGLERQCWAVNSCLVWKSGRLAVHF